MTTAATLEKVLTMRRSGMSSAEMSLVLTMPRHAVNSLLRDQGVELEFPISPRASVRTCISCRSPMISTGPGNRMCRSCNAAHEGECA